MEKDQLKPRQRSTPEKRPHSTCSGICPQNKDLSKLLADDTILRHLLQPPAISHLRFGYSLTVTFMRIGSSGLSRSSHGSFAIISMISIPRMISPKIE